MKKVLKLIILSLILFIPFAYAESLLCDSSGVLKALRIVYYVINVLKILVPVFIIITGVKSYFETLLDNKGDIKDKTYILIEKVIIGGLIFLLPTCIYTVIEGFSFTNSIKKFSVCNECLFNTSKCDGLISNAESKELQIRKQAEEARVKLIAAAEEARKKEREEGLKKAKEAENNSVVMGAKFLGQKYNLTETQLLHIANQCAHEQGSATGAAAEASLMANRFELNNKKYSNIYDYVKNSGWWAHSSSNMSGSPSVSSSVVEAVRQVLVYGNRTLPYYIDEHDCIKCGKTYDITKATNNGVEINRDDRSQYISGVTVLYNRYGATYTFYTFPDKHADPFGYTAGAYKKYMSMKG